MANTEKIDPQVKKRAFMGLASKDFKKALKADPGLDDAWVKRQLKNMGKSNLFFEGVADAIRAGDVGTEKSYKKIQKAGGPLETSKKFTMTQQTNSLKRRLKKYADSPEIKNDPDAYVRSQLEKHGKADYAYPGVSQDILNGNVGTEGSYTRNPRFQEWIEKPEQVEAKQRIAKRSGETYAQRISELDPEQQKLQNEIIDWARQLTQQNYAKIGQSVPAEQQLNDFMTQRMNKYNSGGMPQFRQDLSALGQGAQNLGQSAYNTINPYLQAGAQKGGQLAQSGLNQAQSYLSAAQPYAKKAADLGSDILSQIRAPAMAAGQSTIDGIGSLLGMLKGRM